MDIAELVLKEEWAELPEDPESAFAAVVSLAQPRLRERLADAHDWAERTNDYSGIGDVQYGFMSSILGVAKAFEVSAFANHRLPLPGDWSETWHRNFQSELNHFVAQVTARDVLRTRRSSVRLDDKSRGRIRSYIHALKVEIDNSGLPQRRKEALLNRLAEFETELNGKRVNLLIVSLVVLDLLAAPAAVWGSVDVVRKLTTNTLQALGEARSVEVQERAEQIASEKPLQITLISYEEPRKKHAPSRSYDLNDDIPF